MACPHLIFQVDWTRMIPSFGEHRWHWIMSWCRFIGIGKTPEPQPHHNNDQNEIASEIMHTAIKYDLMEEITGRRQCVIQTGKVQHTLNNVIELEIKDKIWHKFVIDREDHPKELYKGNNVAINLF